MPEEDITKSAAAEHTDDAAWPDWLAVLLARVIRATGLLQPDQPLLGQRASLSEVLALQELIDAASLTQRDLAERLGLEKSTVSRLVAGLEGRGLVTRRRNPDNRRYYQVAITSQGRTVVDRFADRMREYHGRILAAMTPAEQEALATGLSAFVRAIDQTPRKD